jgi:hypothetical protein
MSRYRTDGSSAVAAHPLTVGQKVKLDTDRRWWTVRAVTENFVGLTRQAEFEPAGTNCYTVVDWRNGVRGPCNLIGQTWGDGSYSETECAEMLARFESGDLEISQRNWVPIEIGETR